MKTTNSNVISMFVNGTSDNGLESHTGNLWVSGGGTKLMNYNTILIQHIAGIGFVMNETKYSSTTSKIQTQIRRAIPLSYLDEVKYVSNVPMGTNDLTQYVEVKN